MAENQYFMQLDQLRHSVFLEENVSFEKKRENLYLLQNIKNKGFRHVFERNLERDIEEIETEIAKIKQARVESEAAAAEARRAAEVRAEAAAQRRKEQAVRINPLIFDTCGIKPNSATFKRSGLICP